jgi:salicylate biosynthesis isochorismate synthase
MTQVLFPPEEIESLRSEVGASNGNQLTIPTVVHPVDLVRAAASLFRQAQLICHPNGTAVAGLGAAWSAAAAGGDRFARLQAKIETGGLPTGAPIFSGFSFHPDGPRTEDWDGFPSAAALLPQVALVDEGQRRRLVLTRVPGLDHLDLIELLAGLDSPAPALPFDPGDHSVVSHPPTAQWRIEVEEALGAIAQGDITKVVLSRSVAVTTELAPNAFDIADHLRETYPQCHVFVWQVGESMLVGASPELLLEMSGRSVRVNPLAGSARRGEGEADDRALGEALMASAKDRHEHDLVVQDIAARLGPVVEELHIPAQPSLRRMATVQHLSSEIVGRTTHTIHPLEVVDIMHPTPAVGGTPRNAALTFLDKIEGIDRGWYTGGIGWLTADGDATFAIPLRCALIRRNTASLYAGAGIVGESRPESELDETRLKFRPMLSVLTAT